jgi:hypothetical protein
MGGAPEEQALSWSHPTTWRPACAAPIAATERRTPERLIMKTRLSSIFATLALTGAAAYAQSLPMTAAIPFDFVVGNQTMSAGAYTFGTISSSSGVLLIRSDDWKSSYMINTIPAGEDKGREIGELVFTRYGNAYFLSVIRNPGWPARQLPKSKREAMMIADNASQVAVTMALHRTFSLIGSR